MKKAILFATILLSLGVAGCDNDENNVGKVDTKWNLIGPNHSVTVESFADPKVDGITCWVSRAKTGGVKGAIGIAEDASDASIECIQTGPIIIKQTLKSKEKVFDERLSLLFKQLEVTRMTDLKNNSLVYLTTSTKLIDGSPKNSIAAVTLQSWEGTAPDISALTTAK